MEAFFGLANSIRFMALHSQLFRYNNRLQAALTHDPSHVTFKSQGEHVRLIQIALVRLGYISVSGQEYIKAFYGPTTADAVLRFKTIRRIINSSYQKFPDNIVGKMTIRALDLEMLRVEALPR